MPHSDEQNKWEESRVARSLRVRRLTKWAFWIGTLAWLGFIILTVVLRSLGQ